MFGRASRKSAICARYQIRLTQWNQRWQQRTPLIGFTQLVRRQSSTVPTVPENDEREDNSEPPTSSTIPNSDSTTVPRSSGNSTKFRRWRPPRVEDIGFDALGEPAEVLLLPTRDRKTLKSASKDIEDVKRTNIQQSLDLDLQPVSLADALKNIGSLRTEMEKDSNEFTTAEWNDRRRRLADGFTKAQLQEYLRVTLNKGGSSLQSPTSTKSSQKLKTADLIMMKSWGWACMDKAPKVKAASPISKSFSVEPLEMEFVLVDTTQILRHIADNFDVQVDVFKNKNRIEIVGWSATAVSLASARLRETLNAIRESTLKISDNIAELFRTEAESNSTISKLAQKHNLLIRKGTNVLNIVGRLTDSADVIFRDLLMLSGRFHQTTNFTVWQQEPHEELLQVPFYPEDLPEWIHEGKSWYRHVSSCVNNNPDGQEDRSGNRKTRRMAETILKLDRSNQDLSSRFVITPGALKHEYHVNIGQVLFGRSNVDAPDQAVPLKSELQETLLLASYHALLPQILSRKEFVSLQATQAASNDGKVTAGRSFLLRLRLRPLSQAIHTPPLELLLSGDDIDLGLRQGLKIQSVVAVIEEWRHSLLLPHQPVDIQMIRRSELSLLGDASSKPAKECLKILRQIESFLGRAQFAEPFEFPAIWRLDINSLLKGDIAGGTDKVSDKSSGIETTTTYILDPPEFLDVAAYTSSFTEEGYLEHITCDAGATEKPLSRQTLRITQTPLWHLQHGADRPVSTGNGSRAQKQKRLRHLVGAAYDIAQLIQDTATSVGRSIADV